MDRSELFPLNIDTATIKEREDFFLERNINHPILNKTYLELMEKIKRSPGGRVYLIFGPTGVGKSTLCQRVKTQILKDYLKEMPQTSGLLPVASIELPSPDNGKFNWKDFYQRMLQVLHEPLIKDKVDLDNSVKRKKVSDYLTYTSPELRKSLENAIIYRETRVILLDEAQHLLKMSSGRRLQDQMDAIKSLANLTGSVFVMFGTYELMNFLDLNGQLSRRSDEIHFRRYNARLESDLREFKSVLNTFQLHMPFNEPSILLPYWELMYERSVGCIGILKEWLDVCLKDALHSGLPNINYDLIVKHAPSPTKSLKIAEEAIEGERKLSNHGKTLSNLQKLLGVGDLESIEEKEESISSPKEKRKNVGRRKPNRDQVGITENGA
ncbi:AAA family ATPase [Peribacillus sp. NPDC096540]|uniref:ATP-binding protein n=1 Tax=Peribacillus sp. NPDC096540 TaxID=3390612 RepID=UPI003CFF4E04